MQYPEEHNSELKPTTPEEVDAILRPWIGVLRQEMQTQTMPSQVELALMAKFKAQHRPAPWYQRIGEMYWQWASGIAVAILTLSVTIQTSRLDQDWSPSASPIAFGNAGVEDLHSENIPFVALGSGEEIVMQDNMRIVQAEVPHAMLASMGISVSPDQVGGSSTAEMLYGANNQPLAVRFVPHSLK
ncbi:hypothetical protein RF679_06875 [Undibacterium cyanobacteriorum]|uniref:Anti sigma-E protein RseA N-terminal domain-containing protein n=1 Tax=Undibacterium cyanobacteriorum TaxID=3073561 RepID=A0ABY9RMA0_9BURK|nr:hypothetical protein [Undibacterium sp. 20NA77.5]WMW82003.1 hypothetical protein RF679_06875 [Undibacterium sp. 20NA77.5]